MNVEIFALCDAANADSNGKLSVLGVFDQIQAPSVPIIHASGCSVAVRMRFDRVEEGQKALRITVVDIDGREAFPTFNANVEVRVPPNESSAIVQIVLRIQQLNLPHFGEYRIDLAIDGRVEKSVPLFARQRLQPEAA
jgi:hypothetical protein